MVVFSYRKTTRLNSLADAVHPSRLSILILRPSSWLTNEDGFGPSTIPQGKARTHFALIHSDGTPLARALAEEVIAADRECRGGLDRLICLNPEPPSGLDTEARVAEALAAYCKYLDSECGFIQLDGLPADSDVGSRRLRLENLFVPLHLDVTVKTGGQQKMTQRQDMGAVLAEHPRLALLAAPGGGKSTLVKRLAIAYADPARREQIDDSLPQKVWLPLFFRCRELRDLARGSFAQLLEAISQREPVRQNAAVFRNYVDHELLAGRVLLLIDGLDEILRSLATVPHSYAHCALRYKHTRASPRLSRLAKPVFRHIAAHLAPICTHATISEFDSNDILRLCVAWHREVVDDTEKVRIEAEKLADAILKNDRIKGLAVNPLLLHHSTIGQAMGWLTTHAPGLWLHGEAVESTAHDVEHRRLRTDSEGRSPATTLLRGLHDDARRRAENQSPQADCTSPGGP